LMITGKIKLGHASGRQYFRCRSTTSGSGHHNLAKGCAS
jgi:hypothetical protein